MRLKPLKFIGHKIGPFEHIELNWNKESRYTLIVGENGMGKTTLVAAIAACLSFGDKNLFPHSHFERFAHSQESFAGIELDLGNETGWLLRWTLKEQTLLDRVVDRRELPKGLPNLGLYSTIMEHPGKWSPSLARIIQTWQSLENIGVLAAAYGVGRDIQQPKIRENRELDQNLLKDILNPFAPIQSGEIFQWIANQYIYHALAISENKPDEAQAYLAAIQRVEHLLSQGLEYPISFQVKRNPFRLEVQQNGAVLSVDQLSDGTRSFLSWPLDYLMRASRVNWANPTDSAVAPGLILVDEIDAHLHPEWQRRIMQVVSELLPETYIIATTHSPFVVGATDEAQIFQIYKGDDGQLTVRESFDELYGYPADLVLEKTFVPSLYAPEVERDLLRLSELAGKIAFGDASPTEKQEHDKLLKQLAEKNPWLNSLLALSQAKESSM
jgi:energy-coupling factor transporter ATP-binding protein EcfA2